MFNFRATLDKLLWQRLEYSVVSAKFDRQFYLNNNGDVRRAGVDPCQHYLEFGWKEGRNPTPWFDTAVYLREHPDLLEKGVNPFFHYLKSGGASEFIGAKSEPIVAPRRAAPDLPPLIDLEDLAKAGLFNVEAYVQATGSGPFAALSDALEHAINHGVVPAEALLGNSSQIAGLLLQFGNVCRGRGLHVQAESFYLLAHEQDPTLLQAAHQLGDCFLDARNAAAAAYFYRLALTINDQYFWTHINLAKALSQLGRYDEAVVHARTAQVLEPGSVFIALSLRDMTHSWGHRLIGNGFAAARNREFSRSRQLMSDAVVHGPARLANPEPSRERDAGRPLHVAMLVDDALPQCLLYRVTNKVYQLELQGASVTWLRKSEPRQFEDALAFADVAIFYRVPATPEIVDAIRYARSIGKPTFYDIDDLIFSSEHYPESFESYANLISWDEYCGLAAGAELFRLAMRECDYGIASTAALAEHMKDEVLTGEVIVVPNSLGPSHLRELAVNRPVQRTQNIEIFYGSGTLAHKQDFEAFAGEVLAPLLDKHPRASLTLAGRFSSLAQLNRFGHRVKRLAPDWNFEQYLRQLRNADINIAVVNDSVFNDCKSEIKWLEAAMFGVPSVLSRTVTHRLTIEDGRTGLLCATNEEWLSALDRLVADSALRQSIGQAAQEVVKTKYSAGAVGTQMLEALAGRAGPVGSKHRLRIALVHVFYPPQAIGGATRVVQENVDSLRARYGDDIEIEIFTTTEGGERPGAVRQYIRDGLVVTAITVEPAPLMEWRAKDAMVREAFARYLEFTKPDIVHFHCVQRLTGSVVEAARAAGIPYVVTVHDGWWLSDHQFLIDDRGELLAGDALSLEGMHRAEIPQSSIDRTMYLRGLLADAEAVLAVSESFAEIYRGVGLDNVRAIENGTTRIEPVPRDIMAGEKVRLGFIGGLAVHKGFNLLRQVWMTNKFKNLELVLVDHAQPELTVQRGVWNGNSICVVGRVQQHRINSLYASLDGLLAVSLWPESYGLVTREAAQAGLWVIASDRGAIGDVVEEGLNGFRVDVSDYTELEKMLRAIDAAPDKYRRRTKHPVSLRTFDEQVDKLVELYWDIAEHRNRDGKSGPGGVASTIEPTPASSSAPLSPESDGRAAPFQRDASSESLQRNADAI